MRFVRFEQGFAAFGAWFLALGQVALLMDSWFGWTSVLHILACYGWGMLSWNLARIWNKMWRAEITNVEVNVLGSGATRDSRGR